MGARDFITPNIDRLASSGARFTDWYSNSPVCSPSRAALLTGRYPGNAGVRAILAGHRKATGLTPKAPTLAAALKDIGYHTGIAGKWHLGLNEESRPLNNGFETFYGFMAGCIDYYSHIFYWGMADGHTNPTHDLWKDNCEVYDNGKYFTELVTENSVEYIREKSREGKPFFLYTAYNAPHYPMHAPEKYIARFPHLPWDRQVMAAMISAVDDGVGDILDELERSGILEDTIIFFQSDNGPSRESRNWLDGTPDPYYGGTAGGFKGHKFSLFEGGIRVPGIFSWLGKIPSGQVINEPCAAMDVFPTLLRAAGGDPSRYEIDGLDIMSVLTDCAASPHDMIFWEMENQTAVRQGKYKLVLNGRLVEHEGPVCPVHLSDLSVDPGEEKNLADDIPEVAQKLKEAALEWREGIEKRWETEWAPNYKNHA
jgi:arylsulfatase A-like enzyme